MARFRLESQATFTMPTAALLDHRLRRPSVLLLYAYGAAGNRIEVPSAAQRLGLSTTTVRAALSHLRASGWALDLGDDHLFLDMPLVVHKNGSLREDEYCLAVLSYALRVQTGDQFTVPVPPLSPEAMRSRLQVLDGGQSTEGN